MKKTYTKALVTIGDVLDAIKHLKSSDTCEGVVISKSLYKLLKKRGSPSFLEK